MYWCVSMCMKPATHTHQPLKYTRTVHAHTRSACYFVNNSRLSGPLANKFALPYKFIIFIEILRWNFDFFQIYSAKLIFRKTVSLEIGRISSSFHPWNYRMWIIFIRWTNFRIQFLCSTVGRHVEATPSRTLYEQTSLVLPIRTSHSFIGNSALRTFCMATNISVWKRRKTKHRTHKQREPHRAQHSRTAVHSESKKAKPSICSGDTAMTQSIHGTHIRLFIGDTFRF